MTTLKPLSRAHAGMIVRVRVLCGFLILFAILIIVRLYFLQIVHGDEYQKNAMGQYTQMNPTIENRGTIFFTGKDGALISAAVMQSGFTIAIQPPSIKDAQDAYERINAIVSLDRARFMAAAMKKSDPYEEVAQRVNEADAQRVRALKIPGVILAQDVWRYYPGNLLGSNVLGFVGYKGESKTGLYGLERSYQDTLVHNGNGLYVNPFAELFANVQDLVASDPATREGSIVTSIEPRVERELEKTLDDVIKTYTPKLAGGIVMDPHTGEIIAMGVRPSFDPNTYNLAPDPSVYGDPLVDGRFELGSIMKPLTVASGIDAGAITPTTTYDDKGCIRRSTATICNFDQKARGVIPMQEILNQSLNVGVTFIADTMGHSTFTHYIQAYGFGQKTGIDIPNEVTGDISTLGNGNGPMVNYAAASFGQGIAVSPIEMIRALSSLANNGILPNPHIVTAIKYDSGITRKIPITHGPQVIKPATAETLTHMLSIVFDDALLKGALKMDHYSMAAKTGTAQMAQPGGGYYKDRYLHSFFGYFPASSPRFIIFLFTVEPHGAEFASATLARPYMDIAQFMINYYNIPPDR